jgi:hypothetical protein
MVGIEILCCHEANMSILFVYTRNIVLFICGGGLFIIYNASGHTVAICGSSVPNS